MENTSTAAGDVISQKSPATANIGLAVIYATTKTDRRGADVVVSLN